MHWISVAPCKDGFIHFSEGELWSHPMCGASAKPGSSYVVLKLHMLERLKGDHLMCQECLKQTQALFD